MLHQYYHIDDTVQVAVWEINESEESWLLEGWMSPHDIDHLATISHPIKRLEFIAGRATIRVLLQKLGILYQGLLKTSTGKPYLKDLPHEISLSHSYPFATAIIHTHKDVGIDIEQPKEKLYTVARKFLAPSEKEIIGGDLRKITIAWCIKEALYKLHAKGNILFSKNMKICPLDEDWKNIEVQLILEETHTYQVTHTLIKDHHLCWLY